MPLFYLDYDIVTQPSNRSKPPKSGSNFFAQRPPLIPQVKLFAAKYNLVLGCSGVCKIPFLPANFPSLFKRVDICLVNPIVEEFDYGLAIRI